jgi:hypothetical protein
MFIALRDVPSYERHLLFCADLERGPRGRRPRRRCPRLSAVNRSLSIHDERVKELFTPGVTVLQAPARVGVA